MLKALELIGFKSFADKTRFEFPRGITCVVGPNGSGKSNVVDAIKWVLGEQSVKSLRGKEMADCIFNGSAGRAPMNAAETTLTFDNSQRVLAVDAPEVHVTRRVYRNGEGEYLINRQPCRLRDIRDLFAGTGVATEAYSVIEQGKVDVLLQSSPRDRRAIFEEAAGISRFKAKKIESLRRLDRVEQNLLRLSDIVEEVENRLRSVRLQASKARRYKEHTDRLQALRTQVGLADWRKLGERLAAVEAELAALAAKAATEISAADAMEAQALDLELAIGDSTEAIRACEARLAANRERIAAHEATVENQRTLSRDLEEQVSRNRRHLVALGVKAGDLRQQLQDTVAAVTAAEETHRELGRNLAGAEQALSQLVRQMETLRTEHEAAQAATLEELRAAGALNGELSGLQSREEAARAQQDRCRQRIVETTTQQEGVAAEVEILKHQEQELAKVVDHRWADVSAAQGRLAARRQEHAARQTELNSIRQKHSGATERAAVLEELENRLEGLTAGVKLVLERSRSEKNGPFREVRGLVADLLQAKMETATLVELALGDKAQFAVIGHDRDLLAFLQSESYHFPGRVGFLRLDSSSVVSQRSIGADQAEELSGCPGVIGRADQFVEMPNEFADLARRLLGDTWFVETLSQALELAAGPGRGQTFITLAGEMLASDGILSVGPRQAAGGLISRRSELRALKQQIAQLAMSAERLTGEVVQLEERIGGDEEWVQAVSSEHRQAVAALGEQRLKVNAALAKGAQLSEQRQSLDLELSAAGKQLEAVLLALEVTRSRLQAGEQRRIAWEAKAAALGSQLNDLRQRRQESEKNVSAIQVQWAKSEERLGNLRSRRQQFEHDQQERARTIIDSRTQLNQCQERARQAQWTILNAETQIAELYLGKESLAAEAKMLAVRRDADRNRRSELLAEAQARRAVVRNRVDEQHGRDLIAQEVRLERSTLADRLREDYGIELAELQNQPSQEDLSQRTEVEQEIADLRRKINHLGNVNLDALAEAEQLEARFASLSAQFEDLTKAKASLEQIIHRINADSRRLFTETLEAVRGHFQVLFRKLFGGGQADVILEEGVDILESGVEIVARPPGKEPRSISLLSGGEKTLTCVALLLAIFQYRPSPFCVLDEVDAALDEANIERFIAVLKDFLAWTQFVVVTHSKKTMTCATTLYGVTMQESGVSKRVAVRFEDVSDDGHIKDSAAGGETQAA